MFLPYLLANKTNKNQSTFSLAILQVLLCQKKKKRKIHQKFIILMYEQISKFKLKCENERSLPSYDQFCLILSMLFIFLY